MEWQGDASGSANPTTITMNSNMHAVAKFDPTQPGGNFLFNPIEDSHVKVGSSSNYGLEPELRIKTSSTLCHTFLKFDLTGFGGWIERATLRLYVNDEGKCDEVSVFQVSNDYSGTATPWEEEGITSDNAPELHGTLVHTVNSIAINTWAEFEVTSAISDPGVYSFALSSPSTSSKYFSSEEGSFSPELVIETGSGDGPASYVLATPITGSGSVDLSPPGGVYPAGSQVTLQAHADHDRQFEEWRGDASIYRQSCDSCYGQRQTSGSAFYFCTFGSLYFDHRHGWQ